MYKFLTKYGQTAALLLGVAVVAIFLISVMSGMGAAGYDMGTDLNDLPDEAKAAIGFFNTPIAITVAMAVICAVLAFVVFAIWDLIKFPKTAIKFLAGFVALIVIFFILKSSASTAMPGFEDKLAENGITDNISSFISAGIWTALGLVAIAVLTAVIGLIRNAFK